MPSRNVVFEDLPAKPSRGRPPAAWRAEVQAKPGKWAWVKSKNTAGLTAQQIAEGFEAVVRNVNGERRVYVRWVQS